MAWEVDGAKEVLRLQSKDMWMIEGAAQAILAPVGKQWCTAAAKAARLASRNRRGVRTA
jgi:hypothetical protein